MSRMSNRAWIFLIIITAAVDFVQWVVIESIGVWLFGAGIGINEVLDPIVGIGIGGYLMKKGVPVLTRPNRVIALCGTEVAAAISAGVAQLWFAAVWYIYADVRKEEGVIRQQQGEEEFINVARTQRYVAEGIGNVRRDQKAETEYYRGGVGRPRGRK